MPTLLIDITQPLLLSLLIFFVELFFSGFAHAA